MRSAIFRQYDARWGKLPYPTSRYSFANNGCGCCACTHLAIELDKYKNITPRTLRKYMVSQGFATRGHGTLWDGITKTLKHYGFDVVTPNIASDMSAAWKELNKGNRGGVLLFKAGRRGGVTWTSGGHYVAFTAYKVKNGKHYFYTKDSGGRHNDGWHCYEDTMKGLLPKIWIVKLPTPKPGKYYTVGKTYTLREMMNVRTGASLRYRIVGKLKKGSRIKCLQTSKDGKWIRYGKYRWICGRGKSKIYIK
jgi:hypothetical protein|nr:MAG TPA: SH3 domain protein [Caudoviricetes sp.]